MLWSDNKLHESLLSVWHSAQLWINHSASHGPRVFGMHFFQTSVNVNRELIQITNTRLPGHGHSAHDPAINPMRIQDAKNCVKGAGLLPPYLRRVSTSVWKWVVPSKDDFGMTCFWWPGTLPGVWLSSAKSLGSKDM